MITWMNARKSETRSSRPGLPFRRSRRMTIAFSLKRRLGQGHFGEVWLALDRALAIDRAVKLIDVSRVTNPDNFFAEAQLLREVAHPNIVRVEEAGRMH